MICENVPFSHSGLSRAWTDARASLAVLFVARQFPGGRTTLSPPLHLFKLDRRDVDNNMKRVIQFRWSRPLAIHPSTPVQLFPTLVFFGTQMLVLLRRLLVSRFLTSPDCPSFDGQIWTNMGRPSYLKLSLYWWAEWLHNFRLFPILTYKYICVVIKLALLVNFKTNSDKYT